jgi:hypothetical protein
VELVEQAIVERGVVSIFFAVDGRYSDVGALGDAISARILLKFDRRSSDYLGGDYLLAQLSTGGTVRVRRNYSSFLDEWCLDGRRDATYAIVVERTNREEDLAAIAEVPGVERCEPVGR